MVITRAITSRTDWLSVVPYDGGVITQGAGHLPRIDLHHQDVCLPWYTKALAALCIPTSDSIALANLTATLGRTRFPWI